MTQAARSTKAEQTRQSIVDAAMQLFRAKGYDRTTMRGIADEAGVSLGNAYYYFGSKEHLIQAFYTRIQAEHAAAVAPVLRQERALVTRLAGVLQAWVAVAAPYHEFAGRLFANAASPTSPLSPFSPESKPTRDAAVDLLREVIDGSDSDLAPELRPELSELLWLLQLGLVLFWVHDPSPGQERTRELIARAVPLVDRALGLTVVPGVRELVDDVAGLLQQLRIPGRESIG